MIVDNENNAEEPQKKKSKKKLVIIALIVFLLAVGVGAFGVLKFNVLGLAGKIPHQAKEEKTTSLSFDEVQVNLADRDHYLSTTVVIEYPENKKIIKEITDKNYKLKDAIIEVLRSKSVDDLDTEEGTAKLKEQLLNRINGELTTGKAKSVYFEEFLIQ
ncbi:flagellar basal body-associated FliL family protein [Candidatus Formimonas warabiya]|uniref:Flagellar protein FliL n=1 Tax=Formimonas warabiya TaxID=1761012 RepID=A0A3G1KT64_FORW1|nr:flagellar basal body-associated FliL family protein [Candidatus Formimonas warabiya]ATW25658.1 hypothetical protein DCMF_13590 [Candidatus Formimonas warabiya]